MRTTLCVVCVLSVLMCSSAFGQQWGDLKLRFVYDGTAPSQAPVNVTKDVEFCGKFDLKDETLIVNKENGGVANVVVYLFVGPGAKPAVHPDLQKSAMEKVVLDNLHCRFEPRICVVQTNQPLVLKNSDTVGHNTNYSTFSNPAQNVLIPAGGQTEAKLTAPERIPAQVACNIHPWMKGYLVVQETPYVGVSNENGELVIKNLPVGKHAFQLWHETGYVASGKLNDKPVEWRRGRAEFEIKSGMNDLGVVKFKPMP